MNHQTIAEIFEGGSVACGARISPIGEAVWNPHPAFTGVYLKHLVKGEDTQGRISCHLVRVEAGHEIGKHIHEGKEEIHEVLGGRGRCLVAGREYTYAPGIVSVIPGDTEHLVRAVDEDLLLFAAFSPALL